MKDLTKPMAQNYEDRLLRVLDYIHDNPKGDLSLDNLADVAAMSRFHWHRVFHGMTGETCAVAVRRIRLHHAACWLVQKNWPIERIAAECGMENVQSFTRIFKSGFGVTPGVFRSRGALKSPRPETQKGEYPMYPVEINTVPKRRMAAMEHKGSYLEIGQKFEKLSTMFGSRDLWSHARGMSGAYYDDPNAVAADELRSVAGIVVDEDFAMPDDMMEFEIDPGRVAVMRYQGPYSGLQAAYNYLYGVWLPESGEEPRDGPAVENYLNNPQDTAPEDLVTEVCMPLKQS